MKELLKYLVTKNESVGNFVKSVYDTTYGNYRFRKMNKTLLLNFDSAISEITDGFNNNDLIVFPAFGTMLGLYRDGKALSHDIDIDLGVFGVENKDKVKSVMNSLGFNLIKFFESESNNNAYEETYIRNGLVVDVFYFHKDEDDKHFSVCYDFVRVSKNLKNGSTYNVRKLKLPFGDVGFLEYNGIKLNVPSMIVEHLSTRYGDDFMTPIKKWDYRKPNKSIEIISHDGFMHK